MRRFLTFIVQQVNGLNLLLVIVLFLLVNATVLPLYRMGAKFTLPSPRSGPSGEPGDIRIADVNPVDYVILIRENLFHPERRLPSPQNNEEKIVARPEIVLYGTYITSELRLAFIEQKGAPVFSPGRGQRHTAMKLGEKVSGFELKQIEPDRILLVRDKESMTVFLHVKKERSAGTGQQSVGGVGTQPVYNAGRQPVSSAGQQFGTGQAGQENVRPAMPSSPGASPLPPSLFPTAPRGPTPPSR